MRLRTILILAGLGVVFVLYVESFRLPAILFCVTSSHARPGDTQNCGLVRGGAKMAFLGLFGPLLGNFAVFANPLLLAGSSLPMLRRTRAAVVRLSLATLVALQTFQLLLIPIPEDEGGVMRSYMVRPLAGWGCWCGATLLALLIALYTHRVPAPER